MEATSVLSTVGGVVFQGILEIPPASLEWTPLRATADLTGASRAHGMAGKILCSEIAGRMHLRLGTLMALTGLVRRTPGKQPWLTRGAPRRPPGQAHDS